MRVEPAEQKAAAAPKPIVVIDYDPAWPEAFREIAAAVRALLEPLVVAIDHVGSTSVPGLCAKPRIDLVTVVASDADIPEAIRRLQERGYEYRGNRYNDGMWTFTDGPGMRRQRLYVCAPGTLKHREWLLFRNHLRSNGDAAEAYGALKRRLAVEFAGDVDGYTRAKGPFVAEIVGIATRAAGTNVGGSGEQGAGP